MLRAASDGRVVGSIPGIPGVTGIAPAGRPLPPILPSATNNKHLQSRVANTPSTGAGSGRASSTTYTATMPLSVRSQTVKSAAPAAVHAKGMDHVHYYDGDRAELDAFMRAAQADFDARVRSGRLQK